jgi:L-fuconolactonase
VTVVDAHLHVWDPSALDYPWLAGVPELDRPFGFAELDAELGVRAPEIDGFVFVQADCLSDQALAEVDSVERLALSHPVLGIVAFAPLEEGAAALDGLDGRLLVVGVRRLLQSEPRGFALGGGFLAGARELARRGLVFDACVTADQLPDVVALADAVPGLQIVLDHAGKPDLTGGPLDPWAADLRELARRDSVCVKLSGLAAQTGRPDWRPADLEPVVDVVLEAFGPRRTLFGSDWPASSGQTGYLRWLDFVRWATAALSPAEAAAVFGGTALAVYGIQPATPSIG